MAAGPRKVCHFPGCTGSCHICYAVKRQEQMKPLREAAKRVLKGRFVTEDMRLIAEYMEALTRIQYNVKKGKWVV